VRKAAREFWRKEGAAMRVMIALDATPQCEEIVAAAASRPWPAGSQFLLLHVLDPFPFVKAPISLQRAQAAAELQLKTISEALVKAGWTTETKVALGLPRQMVSQIASSWKSDLVIVGSHEAGAVARLFLGSTARSVLRHAPCSVEVMRPAPKQREPGQAAGMTVLVATDGSEYSTAAIRSAANRPWPKGSKFKVISIPEPFVLLSEFPYFELKEIEKLNKAALEDAKRYAAAGTEMLAKAGLEASVETPLPSESDAREIVNEAQQWQAHMVILGSHGRRGFDRMTMGSVSEHVALHAPCSVEVIRVPMAPSRGSKQSSRKGARR
jgi:nucleotide-binding universal stress UspA family protein